MEVNPSFKHYLRGFLSTCGAYAIVTLIFELFGWSPYKSPVERLVMMALFAVVMTAGDAWREHTQRMKRAKRYTG